MSQHREEGDWSSHGIRAFATFEADVVHAAHHERDKITNSVIIELDLRWS
jgi:hypothetical protein